MAMHCRYLVYMNTEYDDVLCRWLVTKPIVRPSKVPSDIQYGVGWVGDNMCIGGWIRLLHSVHAES